MRWTRNRFVICHALACALAGPAAAEDATPNAKLMTVLPATVGAKACYTRRYDEKHLAAHPKQRVSAMTFFIRVIGVDTNAGGEWVLDPKAKYDRFNYQFAMSVTRRGEKAISASGYCPDDPNILCIRDCDGGGVTLEKIAGSEALMVKLMDDGILMGDCDEQKGKWLRPGTDDKAFRVEKVPTDQCAALEKSAFPH